MAAAGLVACAAMAHAVGLDDSASLIVLLPVVAVLWPARAIAGLVGDARHDGVLRTWIAAAIKGIGEAVTAMLAGAVVMHADSDIIVADAIADTDAMVSIRLRVMNTRIQQLDALLLERLGAVLQTLVAQLLPAPRALPSPARG